MRQPAPNSRAIARPVERPSLLPWVLLGLALSVVAAQAQSQTSNPPVTRDAPAPGTPGVSAQGSGPQTATPSVGSNAGKSVITPPNVGPGGMVVKPAPGAYPMPVIPPPSASQGTVAK